MFSRPRFLVALAALFALATAGASAGDAPRPAPSASPAPLRHATNLCSHTTLFSWPKSWTLPVPASGQPVQFGERFEIRGTLRRTLEGNGFYETTIPAGYGFGAGDYFWVSERCFNPN